MSPKKPSPDPTKSPQKSTPSMTGPASATKQQQNKKRRRVVLSIQQKQEILERLEENERPISLAEEYGISQQQVSDIKKNRERIVDYVSELDHDVSLKRKTIKSASDPSIEKQLFRWYSSERSEGKQISSDQLQRKAIELYEDSPEPKGTPFKASIGWLKNFKLRYGIKPDASENNNTNGSKDMSPQKSKKGSSKDGYPSKGVTLTERVSLLEERLEELEKSSRARLALLEGQLEDVLSQSPSKRSGKLLVTKV